MLGDLWHSRQYLLKLLDQRIELRRQAAEIRLTKPYIALSPPMVTPRRQLRRASPREIDRLAVRGRGRQFTSAEPTLVLAHSSGHRCTAPATQAER